MLFLDGVGIGVNNAAVNPFFAADLPALRSFLGALPTLENAHVESEHATVVPLDATLGVGGLPQSGTGQTALFTGENAALQIGKHFGPYPYSTLRPIIQEKNILRQLLDTGKMPYFANAYPQKFFDYFQDKQTRLTVTTLSCSYCEMPLHRAEDLSNGKALSGDVTNAGWPRMGYPDIKPITAGEAGRRLVSLLHEYDFVLFEYWRTDKTGHSERMDHAVEALEQIDGLVAGIVETLDTTDCLLIITSDHGNVEDMSTKVHTRNPVPAILYGHMHQKFGSLLQQKPDLTGVVPTLMRYITE